MSENGLRFTKTHEWVKVEGDVATLGLTDYAQHELGDIVFVELPEIGREIAAGDVLTSVESVKSVSEVYTPVSGEVVESNAALEEDPSVVNSDPLGAGWIARIRMKDPGELSELMDAQAYEEHKKG